MARVQQSQHSFEIVLRDRDRLVDGADGVIERDATVPDGVPDGVGERVEAAGLAVVQQHQVEVGIGRGFRAAEPADRDQRHPRGGGDERPQPVVIRIAERETQLDADESGPTQHVGPDLAQ